MGFAADRVIAFGRFCSGPRTGVYGGLKPGKRIGDVPGQDRARHGAAVTHRLEQLHGDVAVNDETAYFAVEFYEQGDTDMEIDKRLRLVGESGQKVQSGPYRHVGVCVEMRHSMAAN